MSRRPGPTRLKSREREFSRGFLNDMTSQVDGGSVRVPELQPTTLAIDVYGLDHIARVLEKAAKAQAQPVRLLCHAIELIPGSEAALVVQDRIKKEQERQAGRRFRYTDEYLSPEEAVLERLKNAVSYNLPSSYRNSHGLDLTGTPLALTRIVRRKKSRSLG